MPDSVREAAGYARDTWNHIGGYLPFMAVVGGQPKMNFARIFETLLIAAIVGLMTNYITVQKLGLVVEEVKRDMSKIERKVDKLYDDIYRPSIPRSK